VGAAFETNNHRASELVNVNGQYSEV